MGVPAIVTESYDTKTILLIVLASCATFCGQILESKAYQLIKATQGGPLVYTQVVIAFLWDILFFNAHLKITDYIGGLLIVGVIFFITLMRAFEVIE